jgi:hypothetical protein
MCVKEDHEERHIDHPKNCKKISLIAGTTTCQHQSPAPQCKRQRHNVYIGAGATDSTSASVRTSAIFSTSISVSISASASISANARTEQNNLRN